MKEKMLLPSSTFALHVHRTNSYKTEKDQGIQVLTLHMTGGARRSFVV